MLADRISRLNESATMKMAAETIRLKSNGIDIINLGIGEPDFSTPELVKQAAKKAIDENRTHYTLNRGLLELREIISNYLKDDFDISYSADEIIVTNGAKQALFNSILTLVNRDDEVIVPTPAWPSYPELVNLTGGQVLNINTEFSNNFKITAEQLKNSIGPKTKALLFCNPNNPSGTVYNRQEVEALVDVLKNTNVYVISDEIYGKLIYDNYEYVSFGKYREVLDNRVIVLQGASKAFAMTGWRLGFAAGPNDIIKAADLVQSHSTSNVSSISQYAAIEAFSSVREDVQQMILTFDERRRYMISFLNGIKGLFFAEPLGAFYIFPKIDYFYGTASDGTRIENSTDLALYLLKNAHVATVPGKGFNAEDYIRISYANSMENIKKGLKKIRKSLEEIEVTNEVL